jgi:branched-chain amino acid transport system ATP-binding protein
MTQRETILQGQNITKTFGGLAANTDVTFDLYKDEILGLIGPNGAGKTTLFNQVNGVFPPSSGKVIFMGQDVTGQKPYNIAKLGMARTHQIVRPLNELTVFENVTAGSCFGHENRSLKDAREVADEVLEFVGLQERRDMLAGNLNVAQKKRLEMARALAARPVLILLDEVLAGLNPSEIDGMVGVIQRVRSERGVSIFMIEHVMRALMTVSDRIIVLDYGKLIAEGSPDEIVNDPQVIEAYLGDPKLAEKLMEGGN